MYIPTVIRQIIQNLANPEPSLSDVVQAVLNNCPQSQARIRLKQTENPMSYEISTSIEHGILMAEVIVLESGQILGSRKINLDENGLNLETFLKGTGFDHNLLTRIKHVVFGPRWIPSVVCAGNEKNILGPLRLSHIPEFL